MSVGALMDEVFRLRLEKIAKENGTSVDNLIKLNNLKTNVLQIGQVLLI